MSSPAHIEFEVPPSAISPAHPGNRHYSIDLSLELERQLEMESVPPTPATNPEPTPQPPHTFQMPDIDPHVLAHIISQLRHQLADMAKERDDLLALLASAHKKESELEDALQHITEKAMTMDEALSDARRKNRDDEEAISMLRTKVEESRRGLMRLQAESRRQTISPMSIDMARANAPSAFGGGGPVSSKRASFTPLTGSFNANAVVGRPNGHRRISSVSDSNISHIVPDITSTVTERSLAIPAPNRRLSGFFGRSSPPRELRYLPSPSPDELENLRKELETIRHALDETRNELTEANEAKEASETCVTALREYIAENNIGGPTSQVKLPPLPAVTTGEETDTNAQKKGWGFKLWKVDTSVKAAAGPNSSTTSVGTASPSMPPVALPAPSASGPAPLARKLTGFFSARASVSSVASGVPSLLPLQPGHAHRDSVYSVSDASSLAEPISPTSVTDADVRVRDVNNSPDLAGPTEEVKSAPTEDALGLQTVVL